MNYEKLYQCYNIDQAKAEQMKTDYEAGRTIRDLVAASEGLTYGKVRRVLLSVETTFRRPGGRRGSRRSR